MVAPTTRTGRDAVGAKALRPPERTFTNCQAPEGIPIRYSRFRHPCGEFPSRTQMAIGLIALNALVLLKGNKQIEKRLGRNLKLANGALQSNHDRVVGFAAVALEQFLAPPAQEIQGRFSTSGLVGEVI